MAYESEPYIIGGEDSYLEAFPKFNERIDLAKLDEQGIDFAFEWQEQLLENNQLEKVVKANFEVNRQLKHLYFEARNQERTRGNRILGFGYPLVVLPGNEELTVAPLFVWRLHLEPSSNLMESWLFTHGPLQQLHYNRYLVARLREQFGFDAEPRLQEVLRKGHLTPSELVSVCNELAEKLGFIGGFSHPNMTGAPEMKEIDELSDPGGIHWSGVVGKFPPQLSLTMLEAWPQPEEVAFDGHFLGQPALDPFQASALRAALTQRMTAVEGPDGSGKSHLLLHLLINALSNGRKCLLVSRSLSTLRDLQQRLAAQGINQFNFLLQDEARDKGLLLEMLKAAAEGGGMPLHFDRDYFRLVLDKAKRIGQRLDHHYQAVRQPVFGPYAWTETVGHYLRSNRKEGKELLSTQLSPQDFNFNFSEYNTLQADIERTQPLYQAIRTLQHPLQQLNGKIFIEREKTTGRIFVEEMLESFLQKAARLQHRYISKTNGYADKLTAYYEHHFRELNRAGGQLRDQLADGVNRYGDRFDASGTSALRLAGVFSGKAKEVLSARQKISEAYLALRDRFQSQPFFDFPFDDAGGGQQIPRVRETLQVFERALHQWRNGISQEVQEEVQRLSLKSVHPRLAYEGIVEELENSLDRFTMELNEAGLLEEKLENKMLTIPKRQKFLEEIIEKLETTRLYLRDYDAFYDWQRNWLQLPDHAQKLMRALVKVKPKNWQAAFESWYLNNVLNEAYLPALPDEKPPIYEFAAGWRRLTPLLASQILDQWQVKREEGFDQLKRKDRAAYNLLFNRREQEKAQQLPLASIFARSRKAITDALPVLLVTPEMAVELFGGQETPTFDYLLFDEAQDIPFRQAATFLNVGRQWIVSGDFQELLPGKPLSLLEKAQRENVPFYRMEINHRWSPGDLRKFGNGAAISDQAIGRFLMHYEQIDGRYDDAEHTNDAEAQQVIHVLNRVRKTPQRTFPRVGIVSFTPQQRDLISDYLLQIKRRNAPGADLVRQLERNGMGVFHLDELTGQHFEVLIVSGTYGQIDLQGNLTRQLEDFNRPQGLPQLNLLMSRATEEVFVLNSIPEADLEDMLTEPERSGTFLLAAYFLYTRSIQEVNVELQDKVAQSVRHWLSVNDEPENSSVFLEEVSVALAPYLKPQRMKLNARETFRTFPLLVRHTADQERGVVLRGDGFFADTPATDFFWEFQQEEAQIKRGYQHLPVWSVNWWRDARQEARRLASQLIKMEAKEEEE